MLSGCLVRPRACQVSECQLNHVLKGARVTCCGQYRPLATMILPKSDKVQPWCWRARPDVVQVATPDF